MSPPGLLPDALKADAEEKTGRLHEARRRSYPRQTRQNATAAKDVPWRSWVEKPRAILTEFLKSGVEPA